MKLGLVTKLGMRNTVTKKHDSDVLLGNYNIIFISNLWSI